MTLQDFGITIFDTDVLEPDFAQLTNVDSEVESNEDNNQNRKSLVAIRSGVKPKLREFDERAEK